jgi:hypothetical protein
MNLQAIHGHTIDVDLLPQTGWALDVGCRDFLFSREILRMREAMLVLALDPGPDIVFDPAAKENFGIAFSPAAVVGQDRGPFRMVGSGEEGRIVNRYQSALYSRDLPKVASIPIRHLLKGGPTLGSWVPDHYALVKLDCEGSEFDILENWPGPIADQISVEFHDYLDRARWNEGYFDYLFGHLRAMGYEVVQHEDFPVGPNNTYGHWDSLLVLKERA